MQEKIWQSLRAVMDPDLKKDIVTLNMVKEVSVRDKVYVHIELTTPACPLQEKIRQNCIDEIKKVSGDLAIDIHFSSRVTTSQPDIKNIKNIVAISSGKGGVGKSTVTTNLAVALAKAGAKVGLIDADIYGPSIPVMFHCENQQPGMIEVEGKKKMMPIEQYGVKLISIGFLAPPDSAVVWRGPMASSALKQFFSDTEWGDLDYLFIDLPPGTSDIHLTLVQAVPVTGAVIVTTPQKVALADAKRAWKMFTQAKVNVPILGLVENMAYFVPEELPNNQYFIFGKEGGKEFAEENNIPLLGQIPIVQSIRQSGDDGYPSVLQDGVLADTFNKTAQALAQQIAIRNAEREVTKRVVVV